MKYRNFSSNRNTIRRGERGNAMKRLAQQAGCSVAHVYRVRQVARLDEFTIAQVILGVISIEEALGGAEKPAAADLWSRLPTDVQQIHVDLLADSLRTALNGHAQ